MFAEYPKALYKDGIGGQFEQLPCVVANDSKEEAEKNAEGWFEIGKAPALVEAADSEEPAKRKPGRPRKTEAE